MYRNHLNFVDTLADITQSMDLCTNVSLRVVDFFYHIM